jgi:two-component system response regulator HydG
MDWQKQAAADILIVEDEAAHAEAIDEGLSRLGHRCAVASNGEQAVAMLAARTFDIIVTDLQLGPGPDGLGVLETAAADSPATKVILITAHSSVGTCRQALQQGAFDYIEKPLDLDELRTVISRAAELTAQKRLIQDLRTQLDEKFGFESIIGNSEGMLRILDTIRRVASSDLSVLILGESGTGKDLLASAIHQNSHRRDGRFVAINCAGLSESLLEDELFGHVKGAFTGQRRHAVPRRSRRHAVDDAGQAAARSRKRRDRPRRVQRPHPGRRPRPQRHQQRPGRPRS